MGKEVKIATAEEYKSKQTKTIRLPSGFHFKIRKMSPTAMAELMNIYGEALPPARRELTSEETAKMSKIGREKFAEILEAVVPKCVVEPKISTNPEKKDELALDDLSSDDIFALLDEITTFSGLTAPAAKIRESFRKE